MTREQLYYQVLIDERDMSDEQRSVAAVIPNVGSIEEPGAECFAFDYVDHRHMLPYNPSGVVADDDRPSIADVRAAAAPSYVLAH